MSDSIRFDSIFFPFIFVLVAKPKIILLGIIFGCKISHVHDMRVRLCIFRVSTDRWQNHLILKIFTKYIFVPLLKRAKCVRLHYVQMRWQRYTFVLTFFFHFIPFFDCRIIELKIRFKISIQNVLDTFIMCVNAHTLLCEQSSTHFSSTFFRCSSLVAFYLISPLSFI